jgi:hypothetical protein
LESEQGFSVHHFLSTHCECSKNIINHLLKRKALQGVREVIHLVDGDESIRGRLVNVGFKVENTYEESALSKFNLQVLPELLILNNGKTLYQGGYGKDQQHSQAYEDARLIQDLQSGKEAVGYPVFGCANGKLRKQKLDPLGLKYVSEK